MRLYNIPQPSERVGTSPRSLLNSAVFRNSAKCFRIRILQAPTCFRLHHCAKTTKRFNKTTSKNIFSVSWSAVDHVKNTAINNINIMVRCWGLVLPFGTWAAVRTDEATGELQLILYNVLNRWRDALQVKWMLQYYLLQGHFQRV